MQQVDVRFNSVEQIQQFVNVIEHYDANFNLGSGQRIVNAKSILGVLSLDFSGSLRLRYDTEDSSLKDEIKPFIYQG